MIIDRYVRLEILRLFFGITLVLLLIFSSQQMVRYLNMITSGKVEARIFFQLFMIEVPYLLAMLMPVGFYLAVLLGLNRLYTDHEMVVLKQLGLTHARLIRVSMYAVTPVVILLFLLMGYCNPILSNIRQHLLHQTSAAIHLVDTLASGRFQVAPDGKTVVYANQVSNEKQNHKIASQVFVVKELEGLNSKEDSNTILAEDEWRHKKTMILMAKKAYELDLQAVHQNSSNRYFVAEEGARYWGAPAEKKFEMTKFLRYQFSLPSQIDYTFNSEEETLSTVDLWQNRHIPSMAAELQWRIAIPISVLLLTLFAIQITYTRPRQNRIWFLLFGMMVFLAYFNLLIVGRHWIESLKVSAAVGLWWIHALFLALIIFVGFFNKGWRY